MQGLDGRPAVNPLPDVLGWGQIGVDGQGRVVAEAGAMFTKSQRFYDAIYSGKDYAEEARRLKRFIADHKRWHRGPCAPSG